MLGNHFDLMNAYAFRKGPFFPHVNQAQTHFRQAAAMSDNPPMAQANIAEGLLHLTEAIGEMGLKLNIQG